MRRLASTLLFLVLISLLPAYAQWYLFPGKKNNKAERDTIVPSQLLQVEQTIAKESDTFVLDIPQTINATLLLPLKSTTKPSRNFYEFYTGALLAVSDFGKEGWKVTLNVFDTEEEGTGIPESVLAGSHIIIGPVRSSEIRLMLPKCTDSQYIISPLEPKALSLTDSCNVIQLPVSWEKQIDELVEWMSEEQSLTDEVFLLKEENPEQPEAQAQYLERKLEASGISFIAIPSSSVSDLQLAGRNAFIIASENERFICDAVNNISKLASEEEGPGIALYGQARFKSLDGINSESLFKSNARLTSNYHIDYTDPKVKDFILRFRSVFGSEPSSFAFHGYDTMNYFLSIVSTYGVNWRKKLAQFSTSGLQTDFKFMEKDGKGAENCAVRRVRYYPDLSTSLQ